MIFHYLSEGFILGLSLSATCIGTCGPIYFSYLLQKKSNWRQSIIIILQLSGARFVSYALFGILAGYIGREIGSINRVWFTIVAYYLFSALLIISAFRTHRKEKGCTMTRWQRFIDNPILLGLVTGLNFCPAFLIAVTRAVDVSGPLSGAIVFMAFFFGSNIPLFFFAVFGVMANMKIFRIIGMVSAVVVGTFFIGKATYSLINMGREEKQFREELEDKTIVSILDNTNAYILCKDTASCIALRDILEENRAGPVTLTNTKEKLPDSGYIFIDVRWLEAASVSADSLKKGGRFVIILPRSQNDTLYNEAYTRQVIDFFEKRYFKLDREQGSLFNMSGSVFGRERR